MAKVKWNYIAELLRLIAALIAGWGGSQVA